MTPVERASLRSAIFAFYMMRAMRTIRAFGEGLFWQNRGQRYSLAAAFAWKQTFALGAFAG